VDARKKSQAGNLVLTKPALILAYELSLISTDRLLSKTKKPTGLLNKNESPGPKPRALTFCTQTSGFRLLVFREVA
jgi:hypothetical protein